MGHATTNRADMPVQLPLPGCGVASSILTARRPARHPAAGRATTGVLDDSLTAAYLRRLLAHGHALKGICAYRYQLRCVLMTAERLAGRRVGWMDLFRDEHLFGHVLDDDTAPTQGTRLSRWTLAQRRSAVRSLATLMRPELYATLGEDPHAVVQRALRGVAERVGGGYRLAGGRPRRRGGHVPTRANITAVVTEAGRVPGFRGVRNRAFLTILVESGARVNALRELDGAACHVMPAGHLRLYLHEKGKATPREVELSRGAADLLHAYVRLYNRTALSTGWTGRIQVGQPGPIWRNSGHGRWSYRDATAMLRAACTTAGVPIVRPHDLRRAFATEAASLLPRHVVAQAGGWKGLERLDNHYINPHILATWHKVVQLTAAVAPDDGQDHHVVDPTPALRPF